MNQRSSIRFTDGTLNIYPCLENGRFKVVLESICQTDSGFKSLASVINRAADKQLLPSYDKRATYEFTLPPDGISDVTEFLRLLHDIIKVASMDEKTHERPYLRVLSCQPATTDVVDERFAIVRRIATAYMNAYPASHLERVLANDMTICYFPFRIIKAVIDEDLTSLDNHTVAERALQKLQDKKVLYDLKLLLCHVQQSLVSRIMMPAYGKLAYDGARYSADYTEVDFFREAVFRLNEQGCVTIRPNENAVYRTHYAVGRANHAIFVDELHHLAKVLPLPMGFDPACNFHQEIAFTKSYSQRLIAMGALLNTRYLTEIAVAQANRHASFFKSPNSSNPPTVILSHHCHPEPTTVILSVAKDPHG